MSVNTATNSGKAGTTICKPQNASAVISDSGAIGGAGLGRSSEVGSEIRQAPALAAVGREITRVEPALEGGAQSRPVAVDDREPRGVAVAPAGDHRLPEQALIPKAEPDRG